MKDFVSKPAILLQDIWSDKDVNIVEKSHSLGRTKFNLIDISLNSYGQGEERKYIGSSFYRKNIRKGNTIIENPKNKYCQFARKGTPQIFDIRLQHIQYWQQKKNNLDKFQRNVAQIIFENVNTAFEYGKKVELIKIEKVDGANAQISYNYQYDAWIIASQNVSLLASTSQDLSIYKGNRYQSVLIIAQHWFQLIKDFNKERISELKKLLDGYTAVGSLCGHPNYMNIIKYDSVNVKWYAIVDNYSQDFCTDPLNAKKQLQKFNFKCAEMKSIALTSSSDAFYTALQKLYSKTLQANLQDQQFGTQGSIAYFVVRELQKQRQVTVGATSIKTLQFRFFVCIRQKLEKSVIKKQQLIQIAKKLQKQMCELQNVYSGRAPFPHEYYMKILNAIIQLTEILELKETDIKKRFTKLLKLSFYCLFKRISISKHSKFMIEDENFMNRIEQIPLSKYGSLGCKTRIIYIIVGLPGMFKTYLGQKISNHFQKINVPYQIISLEDLQNIENGLSALYKTQQNPLEHFYLDGSFDSESICKIMKYVQKNRDPKSYYKFMLIKDEVKQKFVCSDSNQYPFSIETIIMCYYGQHQHKINSPRIQQKIDNLKLVTNKLRNYANFDEAIGKLNLEQYHYPFSRQSKLGNVHELSKIIVDVLKGQNEKNEFNMYGILILRLQQCEGIQYMREDSINTEIEHLIKASYPSIPIINFKK